jgi:hypothetical protein
MPYGQRRRLKLDFEQSVTGIISKFIAMHYNCTCAARLQSFDVGCGRLCAEN